MRVRKGEIGQIRPGEDIATRRLVKQRTALQPVLADPLPSVAVTFRPGVNADVAALTLGARILRARPTQPNSFVLSAASVAEATVLANRLNGSNLVTESFQEINLSYTRDQFVPNDPLFGVNTPVAPWEGQWYLKNDIGTPVDVRVMRAWARNQTGTGVVVGIVDDGVETAHADLSPAISAADSFDFASGDADANPGTVEDNHGTSVAGLVGARGGNAIGIAGTAPFVGLGAIRLLGGTTFTNTMIADAMRFRSSGVNRQIAIKNNSWGIPSPFMSIPTVQSAIQDAASVGTILVWSAGNARGSTLQDTNKVPLKGTPDSITVTALGANGTFAWYSSFGACVFVTAPSDADGGPGILSTDRSGLLGYNPEFEFPAVFPDNAYTSVFGGTSAASPIVAGGLAVARQIRPNLDVRFAKHLLTISSDLVHSWDRTFSSDTGWTPNAAGFRFNQNYGFGLLNVDRLARNAMRFSGVTPLVTTPIAQQAVNATIPDNNRTGISRTFNVSSTTPLEDVQVTIGWSHTYRGDIEAYLTSPSGTRRRIWVRDGGDGAGGAFTWTFTSNAFWGENPQGTWTLTLTDNFAQDVGTWSNYAVTLRQGTLIADPNADISQFFDYGPPASVRTGQTVNSGISVRNRGTAVWTTDDGYGLLASDPSGTNRWGQVLYPLPAGLQIMPNQTVRFVIRTTGPSVPGSYSWRWQMVRNGVPFGPVSDPRNVNVIGIDNSTAGATTAPSPVGIGATFNATVRFTNTSNTTWTDTDGYKIVSRPDGSTTWGAAEFALPTGTSIGPGQTLELTQSFTAPAVAGNYGFRWRLAKGTTQFGASTPAVTIRVQ